MFVAIGGHRRVMTALLDSFATLPPGGGAMPTEIGEMLTTLAAQSFRLGVQAAMPAMVAMLLATLVLGLISRTLPQLNVMNLGFGINVDDHPGGRGVVAGNDGLGVSGTRRSDAKPAGRDLPWLNPMATSRRNQHSIAANKRAKQGQVASSHDLTSAALLLGMLIVLAMAGRRLFEFMGLLLARQLGGGAWLSADSGSVVANGHAILGGLAEAVLPVLAGGHGLGHRHQRCCRSVPCS